MSDAIKSTSPKPAPKPTPKPAPKPAPTSSAASGNQRGITPTSAAGSQPTDKVRLSKEAEKPEVGADSAAFLKRLQEAHGMSGPTVGDQVVEDARSHLGTKSQDIDAPNYVNTGGNTNNCANFFNTMLHNRGQLDGRVENVRELERLAQEQGYRLVSQEEAGPGDMAFRTDVSHVELVSTPGATHTIGSNNENPDNPGVVVNGQQWVTERPTDGHEFRYYTNRPADN
ncbi:MAG: hypothetical protein KC800_11160 [Candidatus Eremiobacteraeota bacterium]|nr:hypothetical protein [Candidatus Eremiobacteraeota bacterium]